MTMWIILGSLIGVVVIFLIVTSTLDRKKNQKIKIEKELLSKEILVAGTLIAKEIKKVIEENSKAIKKFVPSVGEVKMSDINRKSKDDLKQIQRSKNFKLLKHNIDKFNLFSNHIEALISEKSNNWAKRNQENIIFFVEFKEEKPKPEELKKVKKDKIDRKESLDKTKEFKKDKSKKDNNVKKESLYKMIFFNKEKKDRKVSLDETRKSKKEKNESSNKSLWERIQKKGKK